MGDNGLQGIARCDMSRESIRWFFEFVTDGLRFGVEFVALKDSSSSIVLSVLAIYERTHLRIPSDHPAGTATVSYSDVDISLFHGDVVWRRRTWRCAKCNGRLGGRAIQQTCQNGEN